MDEDDTVFLTRTYEEEPILYGAKIKPDTPGVLFVRENYILAGQRKFLNPTRTLIIKRSCFYNEKQIEFLSEKSQTMKPPNLSIGDKPEYEMSWANLQNYMDPNTEGGDSVFTTIYTYLTLVGYVLTSLNTTQMNRITGMPINAEQFPRVLKRFCQKNDLPAPDIFFTDVTNEQVLELEPGVRMFKIHTNDPGFNVLHDPDDYETLLKARTFVYMGIIYG